MERNYTRVALNVAEKPSVAKSVSEILSFRNKQSLFSESKFNPVYQFDCNVNNEPWRMIFTSVRGHMMGYDFGEEHKHWLLDKIQDLYSADIEKSISKDCLDIAKNLRKYAKEVDTLILWLDCDREGENIAFEVVDLVTNTNRRINKVLRAHFSALTDRDIQRAVNTLQAPNKNLSDAVEIRQKIDLIIGASFTRLQTLTFRNLFFPNQQDNNSKSDKKVISYGPCQFPTLNFIVERTEKIRNFKPEEFYFIDMVVKKRMEDKNCEIQFNWKRNRLFDELITLTIYERVLEAKKGRVILVRKNPKTRLRPVPLNTVEMQKLISKKLKINSHKAMEIAEKLYQKGFISYPRTETQKFGPNEVLQLKKLVQEQTTSREWGEYANNLLDDGSGRYNNPRQGKLDDKAHPPIHPVKFADPSQLEDMEKKIYALLVKHFLACVSPDAKGLETIVEVEMGEEYFTAKGLIIQDRGYLEIYNFDNWNATLIPDFEDGEEIIPSKLLLQTGKTSAPNFLSESELIALMDKQGIGTDATIHEHIKTIQDRGYAVQIGSIFKPTLTGTALIKSYEALGLEIYKPFLRAQMERDMKLVCDGLKNNVAVYEAMKADMKAIFDKVFNSISRMREFLVKFLEDNRNYDEQLQSSLANYNRNKGLDRRNFNQGNEANVEQNQEANDEDDGGDDGDNGNQGGRRGRGGKRGGRGGGRGGKKAHGVVRDAREPKKKQNQEYESDNDRNNNGSKGYYNQNQNVVNVNNNFNHGIRNQNINNFSNGNGNGNWNGNVSNNFNSNNSNNNFNNFNSNNNNSGSNYLANCPKCKQPMKLIQNKSNKNYFMGCTGYPTCRNTQNINNPSNCVVSNKTCNKCSKRGSPFYMYELTSSEGVSNYVCLGACCVNSGSGGYSNNSNFNSGNNMSNNFSNRGNYGGSNQYNQNQNNQYNQNNNFQQQNSNFFQKSNNTSSNQSNQGNYNNFATFKSNKENEAKKGRGNFKKAQKSDDEFSIDLDNFDTADFFK